MEHHLLYNIIQYLTLNDYLNYSIISKSFYMKLKTLPSKLWFQIAINEYGQDFWIRASKRKFNSFPLGCFKLELQRLKQFEKCQKHFGNNWEKRDYYDLWRKMDDYQANI